VGGFCEDFSPTVQCGDRRYQVGPAAVGDLRAVVELLRDDPLGTGRAGADLGPYQRAFHEIEQDPRNFLVVLRDADDAGGVVAATMQLTLIPGLSRGGATRLQIEAVRVAESHRGLGLGTSLFTWAHDHGRRHGARLAQLTTDKARPEAHRFYASLGYQTSHEGMKVDLSS